MRLLILAIVPLCSAAVAGAAADQPIETITSAVAGHFQDVLTPGHKALLERMPTFALPLYEQSRLPDSPAAFSEATRRNYKTVRLAGIENLKGYKDGIPFPEPSSGIEVIWNQRLRWRGRAWNWSFDHSEVKRTGEVTTIVVDDYFVDRRPDDLAKQGHLFARSWQFSFPDGRPRGTNQDAAIWREKLDTNPADFRVNWFAFADSYLRRASVPPDERHLIGGFLLRYYDMVDMFIPPYSGYTFKLLGKRQFVVPYNGMLLDQAEGNRSALLQGGHPRVQDLRYELRDVWVVEVNALPGYDHPIRKRTFYVDPGSWEILIAELYDRDGLSMVHECHLTYERSIQAANCRPQFLHSLTDGRYLATNLRRGEDHPIPTLATLNPRQVQRRAQR